MGTQTSKQQLDQLQDQMKSTNPILTMNFSTNTQNFSGNSLIKSLYSGSQSMNHDNNRKESTCDSYSHKKCITSQIKN